MELTKLNYVEQAEKAIKGLVSTDQKGKKTIEITTSKIRNILTMVNDLKNLSKREGDSLSEEVQGKVQYLKMRLAYESGRESVVDEFVKCTKLMETLEGIKESKEKLSLFCEYVEALVAYHRYYGGKVR